MSYLSILKNQILPLLINILLLYLYYFFLSILSFYTCSLLDQIVLSISLSFLLFLIIYAFSEVISKNIIICF